MNWFSQKKVYQILLLVFLLGTLLRFYRLDDFAIFLGDQGRDAIIMSRIVTFEHFPAVGPSSSVGQVYLGPFYYYFMAPWLPLFNMHPLGPVVGVALLSSLFIIIAYFMIADLFNEKVALITSALIAFSATLVDLSRFSWNPNILPMMSFIAFYFFIKSLLTKDRKFFALTGIFTGFAFQLHYVTFSLLFAFFVVTGFYVFKNKKGRKDLIKNAFFATCAFIVVNAPLIFFDLRHQFLNSKNFMTLFNNPGSAASASINSVIEGFASLTTFSFSYTLIAPLSLLLLFALLFSFKVWKDTTYRLVLSIFILLLIVTSFMTANKYPHYFGILYPLFYLLLAVGIVKLLEKFSTRISMAVVILTLGIFTYIQVEKYPFLHKEPNHQIAHAQRTAEKMYPLIHKERFRLTAIPDSFGYSAYGYFLEINGKKPVDNLTLEPADEMIVMCERECNPIGNPQWDVAFFGAKSIESSFRSDNVFVYKLIK